MTGRLDDSDDDLRHPWQALRVNPPEGDFRAALHRKLVAAGPPRPLDTAVGIRDWIARRPALTWPIVGVLTGAATFFALSRLLEADAPIAARAPLPPPAVMARGDVHPTYAVPSSKVAVIKLNFAADVAVENVTFEVAVPEGLAFWSRGQRLPERTFSWPGRLDAGDNWIPIAVRGERPGLYRVKARVQIGSETLEHDVVLEVKGGA